MSDTFTPRTELDPATLALLLQVMASYGDVFARLSQHLAAKRIGVLVAATGQHLDQHPRRDEIEQKLRELADLL